jgi:glycosyltransferase involved in cell wall biosynthesis
VNPLRIAIDARVITSDTRGIGRYERAVLRRLLARNDVEVTLLDFGPFAGRHRGALQRSLGASNFAIAPRVPKSADLVWHPANGTFFASRCPNVVTMHDAVPFRYPNPDARKRAHEQEPFLRSVRTAAQFITVSLVGKNELEAVLAVPGERIEVIYLGIEPAFSPGEAQPLPQDLTPEGYLLFVGDPYEARKNFEMLYRAFRAAWPAGEGPRLAIAGTARPPHDDVIALGTIDGDLAAGREAMVRLYRGARAAVVPSYFETFGLPVAEAMACGTPVLASRASSLPEIGADAALYASPDDETAWRDALRAITGDDALRTRLRARGIERAATFTWERCVEAHIDAFRRVAGLR